MLTVPVSSPLFKEKTLSGLAHRSCDWWIINLAVMLIKSQIQRLKQSLFLACRVMNLRLITLRGFRHPEPRTYRGCAWCTSVQSHFVGRKKSARAAELTRRGSNLWCDHLSIPDEMMCNCPLIAVVTGPLWRALIARSRATPLTLFSASRCQFPCLTHGMWLSVGCFQCSQSCAIWYRSKRDDGKISVLKVS